MLFRSVIAGKGVGAGNGSFTYTTNEHCVVMCIYHAVPLLDYTITGQDGQLLVTDAESLPIPEFDNIGMEVLPMTQIFNSPRASIVNLFNAGYNPRYFNWKTKLDVINGAFTTTLKSWFLLLPNLFFLVGSVLAIKKVMLTQTLRLF